MTNKQQNTPIPQGKKTIILHSKPGHRIGFDSGMPQFSDTKFD
jgi:hypothetical protein